MTPDELAAIRERDAQMTDSPHAWAEAGADFEDAANDRRALLAAYDALSAELQQRIGGAVPLTEWEKLEAQRDALEEKVRLAEADAARWRYLRQFAGRPDDLILDDPKSPEEADAMIDAALAPANKAEPKEHAPASSEPDRCCFVYSDGERCGCERTTHSFCRVHARYVREGMKP